jgi:hypothetical protein
MIRTATLIAASLFATSAFAADSVATLGGQQGTVLVNQGEEFITASEAQALVPGDRVMVMEGGSAVITFTDGCALALEAGSLVVVPAASTCSGAVAAVETIGPSYAQAVGAPRERNRTLWPFYVWGAGIAYALIDDDFSMSPVSP